MQRRNARLARPLFGHWLVSCLHVGYEIASGEIINAAGDTTRAQDVIIYDPDVVAGWDVPHANAVLPAEAVVASVEVKRTARSTISGSRRQPHHGEASLRASATLGPCRRPCHRRDNCRPMGLALYFESRLSWPKFSEAVTSAVAAVVPEERPDVFLLPGRGGLAWPPDETGKPLAARTSANDMLVFEGADSNLVPAYAISSHVLTWVRPRLDLFDCAKRQPSGLDLALTRRSLNPPPSAR